MQDSRTRMVTKCLGQPTTGCERVLGTTEQCHDFDLSKCKDFCTQDTRAHMVSICVSYKTQEASALYSECRRQVHTLLGAEGKCRVQCKQERASLTGHGGARPTTCSNFAKLPHLYTQR